MANEGLIARAVRAATRHPVLVLALLCLVQVVPALGSREYWAYDEVRHAGVLREMREEGHAFSLHLNGAPYPDKPPVYFWLVAAIAAVIGTDAPPAFFLASGLGGFLFLVATWSLARATLGPDRRELALLAPLMVMVTPLFQTLLRTTRMDLMFGALITVSLTCLWKGLGPAGLRRFTVLGFALAGTAALIKGPAGLVLPLAAAATFLVWTGNARRLLAPDVLLGLGLALAAIGGWMTGIGLVEGWPYLVELLQGQVVARALLDHKHARPLFQYALLLPIAFLPWTALILAAPWRTWGRPAAWRRIFAQRKASEGVATKWLACAFLGGLLVLSLATGKLFIYLMPLLAPLSVLGADRLLRLPTALRMRVWTGVAVVSLLAAAVAAAAPFAVAHALDLASLHLPGVAVLVATLGATGVVVLTLRRRAPVWPFGATIAGSLATYLVLALVTMPALDPIMSPRPQAEVIAEYVARGHRPLIFRVYPGTYSYYAGQTLPETRDLERLRAHIQSPGPILIVLTKKYWMRYANPLSAFDRVHQQRIEGMPVVVAVRYDEIAEEGE